MYIRGMFLRTVEFATAAALALAVSLVGAVPAQAITPTATIAWNGATLVVNAAAAPATIYLGFSANTFNVPTVTFRLPGAGFASWPGDCAEVPPSGGLPDQYIHCAAADVDDLDVTFGAGNDTLYMDGVCYGVIAVNFGDGANTMQGDTNCPTTRITSISGSGDDVVQMAGGGGTASLGGGNDQFRGGVGNEIATGGPGNDSLGGNSGDDTLRGEDGNDAIAGNFGNDVEDGGNGDDVIGNFDNDQGADDMSGGPGVDKVWFSDHSGGMALSMDDVANDGSSGEGDNLHSDFEIVVGSPGADTITGTAAADNLDGYFGADTVLGGPGNDRIDGNSDDDVLFGGDGDDTIYGGGGNDQVTGDGGADNLFGDYTSCCLNNGNDKIFSADGIADAINCGGGADTLAADQLDVIGGDGNQLCESVTRTTVAPPQPPLPPTPPPPGPSTLTVKASSVGVPTRSKGVVVATVCSAKCAAAAGVVISNKIAKKYGLKKMVLIGLGQGASASGGKFKIKIKIKAKARRKLARAGAIRATVVLVAADAAGIRQTKTFKIKLKP